MPLSKVVLLAVGGLESAAGLYSFLLPTMALPSVIGRLLTVGAVQSSPALVPMIAQAGALRLALGVLILGYATGSTSSDTAHKLETCVVAHACLLQPFAATFRSHPRMPVHGAFALSMIKGGALVAAMAADADFEVDALTSSPYFLASVSLLGCGLLLALIACCLASGNKSSAVSTAP